MYPIDPIYTANMNDQQRAWFYAEYERARKEEIVGLLLALFLGGFGVHKFYLRRNVAGVWYLLFFWTGITAILGFIECFFMPGRVRAYNAVQAAGLAAALGIAIPGYMAYPGWVAPGYAQPINVTVQTAPAGETTLVACSHCQQTNLAGVRYCSGCGASLS